MGATFALKCSKCVKVYDLLCETGNEAVAETLEYEFHLGDGEGNRLVDIGKLEAWLKKHGGHGRIVFDVNI